MAQPAHPIESLIEQADRAINAEDFETLLGFYSEHATLVIQPGVNAVGKRAIGDAFRAIAEHFAHTLQVRQATMEILEGADTVRVLANTVVSARGLPETTRRATYVFAKSTTGQWQCTIDNS